MPVEDFLFSAGGGFLFGAVAGYAIKKVMKIAAVVVGLFIAGLSYLSYIVQIASSIWKSGSRDIRDILKIAKLINAEDTEEDIKRLISIRQKYSKTGREYNN